ncbi:ABC transporter substrate-binding protein [Paraburkholderia fungorum]|uniref:ABC transporter substrate-binding protein n=1 Tax=Paraburkholderia fungorum TaxID=134537 RepID=UPI0038BD6FD2
MAKISRRDFLGVMSASMLLPSLARAAGTPELTSFELLGVRDPQLGMHLAVAEYLGLFKAEGIDVKIRWQQSSGDVLNIMGGGFPIGIGNPLTQIVLASRNVPTTIVCAFADISGGHGVVLAPKFQPKTPRELEGKKCAFTEGVNNPLILSGLGTKYGFDHTKIRMINMEPSEGVVAASRGDVDMLLSWQPFLYRLQQLNGTLYATGNTIYFTQPPQKLSEADKLLHQNSTLVANPAWLSAHPNTTQALLRALIKAEEVYFNDKSKAMEGLEAVLKIPAAPLKVMTDSSVYSLSISQPLANTYNSISTWALANHRILKPADINSGIYPDALKAVAPARVTWGPKA